MFKKHRVLYFCFMVAFTAAVGGCSSGQKTQPDEGKDVPVIQDLGVMGDEAQQPDVIEDTFGDTEASSKDMAVSDDGMGQGNPDGHDALTDREIVNQELPLPTDSMEDSFTPECSDDSDCKDKFQDVGQCQKVICNVDTGKCEVVNRPDGTACDDNNQCTEDEKCVEGKCTDGHNVCQCNSNDDCVQFEDGNLCNGTLVCNLEKFPHMCVVDPATVVKCDSSKDTFCLTNQCDPQTGTCSMQPANEGKKCDDHNKCTIGDTCQNGECLYTDTVECDAADNCAGGKCDPACFDAKCDPKLGCVYTPNKAACDDHNKCTQKDTCSNGHCKGSPVNCDDHDPCTKDSCNPNTGQCEHKLTSCSMKFEAEDATVHGAVVAKDHANYSGTGFVDYQNPRGDYIEWSFKIVTPGNYNISFRYALYGGNRPLEIRVNGGVVSSSLPFPATGSFEKWTNTAPITVRLKAGTNKVRATAIGSSGANVDYMTVSSVPPPSTTCKRFGMYEITLVGNTVSAPDDTGLTVSFLTPSGHKFSIWGFYDGNNVWKARVYCNELGTWSWSSSAPHNTSLNKTGSFKVVNSNLKGKLRRHVRNGRYLMTDNKQTFVNINDTAYFLFSEKSTKWKEYITQAVKHGISSFRALAVTPDDWNALFLNGNKNRFNYVHSKVVAQRLKWMLDNYPDAQVQLIMLPSPPGYKQDDVVWHGLSRTQQNRVLNNFIARYAAFPNVFWLIQNDIDYINHPNNTALANQVGNYLKQHDPFNSLRSTGAVRNQPFQFGHSSWATYIHIETVDTTPEAEMSRYASTGLHVFDGEDRYEKYRPPKYPTVFYRRHMWSWLLSGGSASYGGIWDHIVPYDSANLKGLNDVGFIRQFITDNSIDLGLLTPADGKVSGPAPPRQCQVMASSNSKTWLIYHPNAAGINGDASIAHGTATFTIKNLPSGSYHYKWMNADTGSTKSGTFSHSGGNRKFTAPWPNIDVVIWITP